MKKISSLLLVVGFSSAVLSSDNNELIEPPMVTIPSGTFIMGSDVGNDNERPAHQVKMKGFMMGKYEVTIAEFKRFVAATNYPMPDSCVHEAGPYWFLRPTSNGNGLSSSGNGMELAVTKGSWEKNSISTNEFEPVVCVGWQAAQAYAAWLREQTGKPYRLPTEAEWEYATRAGSDGPYFFGGREEINQICRFANVADKYGEEIAGKLFNASYGGRPESCNDKSGLVSIVGLYQPNAFGLYDTLGNVEEWVQDCYAGDYKHSASGIDNAATKDCKLRVIRGGSWHYLTYTVSQRTGREQDDFIGVLEGFRLALDGENIEPENSTLHFEHRLSEAQKKQRQQMAALLDFPKQPTGLNVQERNDGSLVLNWNEANDVATTGYDIYRSISYFDESHKIANNVSNTSFIDDKPIKGRVRYRIKALNAQRESDWSNLVTFGEFDTHLLPGKIQAEAYFAAPNAIIAASVSEPEGDRGYLRLANSWVKYHVSTKANATYQITVRIFSNGQGKPVELWLGNELLTSIVATGERGWQSISKTGIYLHKGEHVLSVKSGAQNIAINWLQLDKL